MYSDPSFTGPEKTFCLVYHDSGVWDMRNYDMDNAMSSWYCGKGVSYEFCDDAVDDDCTEDHGNSGAGNARTTFTRPDDNLTTLKLKLYDSASQGAVVLFHDPGCTGRSGVFFSPSEAG